MALYAPVRTCGFFYRVGGHVSLQTEHRANRVLTSSMQEARVQRVLEKRIYLRLTSRNREVFNIFKIRE